MDMLGRFRKLDSSLQRGFDNGFARVFGGAVVPAEIEELLKQEAEDSLVYGPHGTLYAPDHYVVYLAEKDCRGLQEAAPELAYDLADQLGRFIRNSGWRAYTTVEVVLKADEDLHSGQLKCHSRVTEQRMSPAQPAPETEQYHAAQGSHYGAYVGTAGQSFNAGTQQPNPGSPAQQAQQPPQAPQPQQQAPQSSQAPQNQFPENVDNVAYESYRQAQAWSEVAEAADTANPAAEMGQVPPVRTSATGAPGNDNSARPQSAATTGTTGTGTTEPAVTLLLQDGSSRTYHVKEGSNIIGRGNQVDFRLPDTGVSRRHAELVWDGEEAVLVDLHSTNGTTVNDTPIDNWLLADGDVITVGHSYIEVRINQPHRS